MPTTSRTWDGATETHDYGKRRERSDGHALQGISLGDHRGYLAGDGVETWSGNLEWKPGWKQNMALKQLILPIVFETKGFRPLLTLAAAIA